MGPVEAAALPPCRLPADQAAAGRGVGGGGGDNDDDGM